MKIMKSFARLPELTTALALIGSLIALTAAAEIPTGKGGARLLTKVPTYTSAPASARMTCGSCQDVMVSRKDTGARGANQPASYVARHLCNACVTSLRSEGHGKSKQDIASHQCAMTTQSANCCGAKN
jgi:hypothetical protein